MGKPNLYQELQLTISEMESAHKQDGVELHQHFRDALDIFRPMKLIKETFTKVAESGKLKDTLTNMLIGISAGYISKKMIESGTKSVFKKFLGTAAMYCVTSLISKNQESIKKWGSDLFNLSDPKETPDSTEEPKE